jgi:hypothetical protein
VLFFDIDASELPMDSPFAGHDVTLGFVALSPEEELEAARTSKDQVAAQYEFAKRALVKIAANGSTSPRDVRRGELEHEQIWAGIGPKGRNLAMDAFSEVAKAGADAILKMRRSFRWSR